ncbi:MAG: hypothetical protein KGJ13_01290 [Patescibacteria group bacterium]|nr:hypothetical protein [Patescibacteria group bacterium]
MEKTQTYTDFKTQTGLTIAYLPHPDGSAAVQALADRDAPAAEAAFSALRVDEAHILYMEATELLSSRAKLNESPAAIRALIEKLFALFRGEEVSFGGPVSGGRRITVIEPTGEFRPNPGKQIEIGVDGVTYERLPVRTRLITAKDTDILPLIEKYVQPYVKPGDIVFVSEKALTITQGRVVDMSTIKPTRLARFLAGRVGNYYGSGNFRGFGHGTSIAMQAFIEEAGVPRVLFAAAVSAITRPFGIKGMFYRICGLRAKSIDCPMSFLILEYAHSVKLAPDDPKGAARRIKKAIGCEAVILDANYRGAFSLGKTSGAPSEAFIEKAFRDNPLGQSDEMTPFCILRRTEDRKQRTE